MSTTASGYQPPLRDMAFVIEQWLDAPAAWQQVPDHAQMDAESARMICEAAGLFCAEQLAPLNGVGDLQGCVFQDGSVRTPEGFREVYQAYVQAGWPALACSPAWDGQGLPLLLDAALNEMIVSANHAWAMYLGIQHGAYACLRAHASPALQQCYLPKLVSGAWLATMCLTEPQAGSDLGLIRAQASQEPDGSYRIEGNKIFISGGDHDLTENIVHLVLARLPDAPVGTKGISLFLVPKRIPLPDGRFAPNAVYCDGLEKKMGIKGSATCAMRFDGARGWLIGEAHRGLAAMFVMMNAARIHVGLQGLGHAESAYQLARAYAAERHQMRALPRPEGASGPSDPIRCHAPVRRILMDLRVWTEGMRALGFWGAHLLDQVEHAPDPDVAAKKLTLAALLTPVIKALFTERGFQLASDALQVFGGYGYVHDYQIEQVLRDSRVAMIYEGTNQIQALDLLQRKVLSAGEGGLSPLLSVFREEVRLGLASESAADLAPVLGQWCDRLEALTTMLSQASKEDVELPARAAEDYLRLVGWVAMAFAWCRAARLADEARADKRESARYFFDYALVDAEHWLRRVEAAPAASGLTAFGGRCAMFGGAEFWVAPHTPPCVESQGLLSIPASWLNWPCLLPCLTSTRRD